MIVGRQVIAVSILQILIILAVAVYVKIRLCNTPLCHSCGQKMFQQLVMVKRCFDLKLDRCKYIRFERVLPCVMGSTVLVTPTY